MVLVNEYGERFIPRTRKVRVISHRTGEVWEGTIQDDGLASLFWVTEPSGLQHCCTVLDKIEDLA